ncbi:MAG: hypothetical protein J6T56_08565 [Bacteroidales bacterium]|nr:hypothetical protein [Bacteroidales bacterium]
MKGQWANRWEVFRQKLRDRYQLIIRNKAFEEIFSIELSRWKVIVFSTIILLFLIALTTLLIAFTPLREYIPGYGSSKQSKELFALQVQVDTLANQLNASEAYIRNLQMVLNGDFSTDTGAFHTKGKSADHAADFAFSREDSLLLAMELREMEARSEKTLSVKRGTQSERFLLFRPVAANTGTALLPEKNGIRIKTASRQPLHAVDAGTAICVEKRIICIQHPGNRISIYRNSRHPLVLQGETVRSGQIIAYTPDDTATAIFEYWIEGKAANPQDHFAFE